MNHLVLSCFLIVLALKVFIVVNLPKGYKVAIEAIVTIVTNGNTLNDVKVFLEQASRLSVSLETELLDGAHCFIGSEPALMASHGTTLNDVSMWLSEHDTFEGETVVSFGDELSVDVTVFNVEEIYCGDHIPPDEKIGVVITTNSECNSH